MTAAGQKDRYVSSGLAESYFALGTAYSSLATRARGPEKKKEWHEARSWYRKSSDILAQKRAQGSLDSTERETAERASQGIANCDAALARLSPEPTNGLSERQDFYSLIATILSSPVKGLSRTGHWPIGVPKKNVLVPRFFFTFSFFRASEYMEEVRLRFPLRPSIRGPDGTSRHSRNRKVWRLSGTATSWTECMGKCSLMIRNKTLTFSLGKASEYSEGSCC
jgi:hypothetical protein